MKINKYWSKKARGLTPYKPGEQPDKPVIKLNTNENAYPPSNAVLNAISSASAELRLYPSIDSAPLRLAAARYHNLTPDMVFCSNGSDEALALCFMAFFDPGDSLKTVDVTYSFYPVWAKLCGITLDITPLNDDFTLDIPALCGSHNVVLANPNAPTGIAVPAEDIERIVKTASGVVVIDEAYCGFGAKSADSLINKYDNLVVVRTLSKSHSLAGLRAGYALAQPGLTAALNTIKDSFNSYPVDRLAQAGGAAALNDAAYYAEISKKIIKTRENTVKKLTALGLQVLNSKANFIFVKVPNAALVLGKLKEKGILVRHFPGARTQDYLRVTIGTDDQMEQFTDALKGLL